MFRRLHTIKYCLTMDRLSLLCCLLLLVFSTANGSGHEKDIKVYELKRGQISAKFTNWGATIVSCIVPDKHGKFADVILGYDDINTYKNDSTYFGAIVGRVANRIADAKFSLNGTTYNLVRNEGENMLHGGLVGFSDVVWDVYSYRKDSHITFTYHSYDGEQGFPGDLDVMVTYMLMGSHKIGVKMEAKPLNKPTPVNLALHAYWNLGGQSSGSILSHDIQIFGSNITPVDQYLIPTGKIVSVKGTPYDFLKLHEIGSRINQLPGGYDINYVLDRNSSSKHLSKVSALHDRKSGRVMELWSNQPGVQFYTSNQIKEVKGGIGGFVYHKYAGICLETQGFPDSVNHPNFPSQIVNPGETYENVMVFRFTAPKKFVH